jgi:hypothetical protein
MYEMERKEGRGLDPDEDSGMIGNFDEDEDETEKEVKIEVVVVEKTLLLDTSCNPFNGVTAPLGYTYTSKLAFICFGPSSNLFSPSLKPGEVSRTGKEGSKKGGQASICKMQEESATIDYAVGINRGILQQNHVTFGSMAQHKDNADQAHRDMRLAKIMECINSTQKMIEFKMTMWERMLDVTTKDSLFVSISSLRDKVEDLNSQLEAIGEEMRTGNPIVLSVLSNAAAYMVLSNIDSRPAGKKTSRESDSDYMLWLTLNHLVLSK